MRLPRSLVLRGILIAGAILAGARAGSAQEPPLAPGDPAPPFTLLASDGKTYRLSDFLGVRPVVIAWFPRAFATL
jgi:hypothetical protein